MDKQYIVKVIESDSGEVVRELGPMGKHKAEKVMAGLDMLVDFEVYHTEMIAATEPAQ